MRTSSHEHHKILRVNIVRLQFVKELARKKVMFFKIEQVLLAPQSRDFLIEAIDVPTGWNPGRLLKDLSCGFLGSNSCRVLCALL